MAATTFMLSLVVLSFAAMATAELGPIRVAVAGSVVNIQGSVFCMVGPKVTPIQGATIKARCKVQDRRQPLFVLVSQPADKNGVAFLAIPRFVSGKRVLKCKVTLNASPLAKCKVALNINRGIVGFPVPILGYQKNLAFVPSLFYTA